MSNVKTEHQDEAEIIALATKIADANKAKMSANASRLPQNSTGSGGTPSILSFLTRKTNGKGSAAETLTAAAVAAAAAAAAEEKRSGDEESQRGRFGWTTLGKCHIPYIFRANEKYCAVRMVEIKVLNKYLNYLHQDIYSCTCIRSYYITDVESRLLNEINVKHCDYQFGREMFSTRDLIVRLNDALEFYTFLDACYNKLIQGSCNPHDRCGFIRINKESVVPYTICNDEKYVPLFYFEGETENLKLKADKLEGWDLSYLKFCCKVQGIRNELFAHETCAVISLNAIKGCFPPGTGFEDYWPSKVVDSQLLLNGGKSQTQVGQWTRQPPSPPSPQKIAQPLQQQQQQQQPPAILQVPQPVQKTQLATQVQAMYSNYGLVGGQPTFRMTQPHNAQQPPPLPSSRTYNPTTSSRQLRPYVYPHMSPHPPHPPLLRAQAPTSSNNYAAPVPSQVTQNYGMMLGEPPLASNPYRPSIAPSIPKYPPPLIPVRVLNGASRYDQTQFPYADVVDLSSSASRGGQVRMNQTQQQQHQHHQPQSNHVQNVQRSSNAMSNGRVNINEPTMNVKKLIPLADTPTSGSHIPYKLQKALVEGKMIPCINMKPYVSTELLVTLQDLVGSFFSNVTVENCKQVMQVLGLDLYIGNRTQMQVLVDSGRCQTVNDPIPLVQVRDVIDYMPQLKYMLISIMNEQLVAKIQRTS